MPVAAVLLSVMIAALFSKTVLGFQTHRDDYATAYDRKTIINRAIELRDNKISNEEIYKKYHLKDNRDWKLNKARAAIQTDTSWENKVLLCEYRPFDKRWCYFSYVMMDYPRKELIQFVAAKENLVLVLSRQCTTDWRYIFISNSVISSPIAVK